MTVLAGHHGPGFSDDVVLEAFRRYGQGAPNYLLAQEGDSYRWNGRDGRFDWDAKR